MAGTTMRFIPSIFTKPDGTRLDLDLVDCGTINFLRCVQDRKDLRVLSVWPVWSVFMPHLLHLIKTVHKTAHIFASIAEFSVLTDSWLPRA